MTSRQHTIIAFLLISSLLSFFRIDIPGMTKAEESFSFHWGLLSIFGTTPFTSDSWGAFTDQAPYLSLGETPFVNPPLPMWGMVAWSKTFGETLPSTRIFSCILAALAIFSLYSIAKNILTSKQAMFAAGLLAGSLIWNDIARHATTEIWGISFTLMSLALFISLLKNRMTLLKPILLSFPLIVSSSMLFLSSFEGMVMLFILSIMYVFIFKPQLQNAIIGCISILIGYLIGYMWFLQMDLPFASQVMDALMNVQLLPGPHDIQTLLLDGSILPFALIGIFIGSKALIKNGSQQLILAFKFTTIWLIISYLVGGFSAFALIPTIIISLIGIHGILEHIHSPRVIAIIIASSFLLAMFGIAPRLLEGITRILTQHSFSVFGLIPLILGSGILLLAIFLKTSTLKLIIHEAMSRILIALVIAALVKVAFANLLGKTRIQKEALAEYNHPMHVQQLNNKG